MRCSALLATTLIGTAYASMSLPVGIAFVVPSPALRRRSVRGMEGARTRDARLHRFPPSDHPNIAIFTALLGVVAAHKHHSDVLLDINGLAY